MTHHVKRNPDAFDSLWNAIIWPLCQKRANEPGVTLQDEEYAKGRLRGAYHRLNEYCSEMYMDDPRRPLGRNKIAACFMFAIVATRPLTIDTNVTGCLEAPKNSDGCERKGSLPFFANERVAISVACSIVLSYLQVAINDDRLCDLTIGERRAAELRINRGVDLLEEVDGGEWLLNLEKALALTAVEGNINIPLMSCLIAYLESTVLDAEVYTKVLKALKRAAKTWEDLEAERDDE